MEVNQYAKKIKEKYPDFIIALGNEVYLVDKREPGIKYNHFILTAKDEMGHKALRELSSIAWYNAYTDRGMERVPITKEELATVMAKYTICHWLKMLMICLPHRFFISRFVIL